MAGDVSFLYQVGDCFSARNMLLWPRKWQICDAELGRLKSNCEKFCGELFLNVKKWNVYETKPFTTSFFPL